MRTLEGDLAERGLCVATAVPSVPNQPGVRPVTTRVVLDTGAETSVVHRAIISRLLPHLPRQPQVSITWRGDPDLREVVVASMALGSWRPTLATLGAFP